MTLENRLRMYAEREAARVTIDGDEIDATAVPTCGAPTRSGTPCRQRVSDDGDRCRAHQE